MISSGFIEDNTRPIAMIIEDAADRYYRLSGRWNDLIMELQIMQKDADEETCIFVRRCQHELEDQMRALLRMADDLEQIAATKIQNMAFSDSLDMPGCDKYGFGESRFETLQKHKALISIRRK